jgi:hypothetical protein
MIEGVADAVVLVLVVCFLVVPIETVVFGGATAEISGAGIFARIADVVMGTAGPSFSAKGDPV